VTRAQYKQRIVRLLADGPMNLYQLARSLCLDPTQEKSLRILREQAEACERSGVLRVVEQHGRYGITYALTEVP